MVENQKTGNHVGNRLFGVTQSELYGIEFDIVFNEKKTICIKFASICIKFGRNIHDHYSDVLCVNQSWFAVLN